MSEAQKVYFTRLADPCVIKDRAMRQTAQTFMGRTLELDSKIPEGVIRMHAQTIFELTGWRPEGPTSGDGQDTLLPGPGALSQ